MVLKLFCTFFIVCKNVIIWNVMGVKIILFVMKVCYIDCLFYVSYGSASVHQCITTFWFGYTVIAISSAKSVKRSVFPQFDCQCGLNSSKLLKFFPWGISLGWEVLGTPAVHHSKYWLVVVLAPESQQKGNPVMDK